MSTFTLVVLLLIILVVTWAVWFLIDRTRRIKDYENEVDKRLQTISR